MDTIHIKNSCIQSVQFIPQQCTECPLHEEGGGGRDKIMECVGRSLVGKSNWGSVVVVSPGLLCLCVV